MVVTDRDDLAERVRLIRNHAESVVEAKGEQDLTNMLGFNFRMTEMEAAVARCQLSKLPGLLAKRRANCRALEKRLAAIPALTMPAVRQGGEHAYYVHACKFDATLAGVPRNVFVQAVRAELPPFSQREAEGVKLSAGYVRPLYLLPLYQQRMAYGSKGYPFSLAADGVSYAKGLCPVTERMHEEELFIHELMLPCLEESDLDDVAEAFAKVWRHRDQLTPQG
jgi:dTDP-4-amino-4,6-dideoxygalactose transaminase